MPVKQVAARFAARVPTILYMFVIGVACMWLATWLYATSQQVRLALLDQTDVFEYESVEYVSTGADGVRMRSVASWPRDVDEIVWNDQLRCGQKLTIFSTSNTSMTDRKADGANISEWRYGGAVPSSGGECAMRSTITVSISGRAWRQTIWSEPFRLEPTS